MSKQAILAFVIRFFMAITTVNDTHGGDNVNEPTLTSDSAVKGISLYEYGFTSALSVSLQDVDSLYRVFDISP